MKTLYLAYMWWRSQERLMEDHEILMIVADSMMEAKQQAKEKTKLTCEPHVDILIEVKNIDGYNVLLEKWWLESMKQVSDYEKL